MIPQAVALAGPIGAGKTTVSEVLAQRLGWPRVGFGDHVRSVAIARGLDRSRSALQNLGASLIEDGWPGFVAAVLSQVARPRDAGLIIDGVRHEMAISTLRELLTPLPVFVAYLEVSEQARRARLAAKATTRGLTLNT